jgi:bacterioferritin
MIGNTKLIEALNNLLVLERTGIDQYLIHRAMFNNWQFALLVGYIDERIADERNHQSLLEDRILFLQGSIVPAQINQVIVGDTMQAIFANDQTAELTAITAYNAAVSLAVSVGDEKTAQILRGILSDEDDHLNDIEARQMQMELTGMQNWMAIQIQG